MRICLRTIISISRNIYIGNILICRIIPVNLSIEIDAVNILNGSHIVLSFSLSEQLLTITAKEETAKLNVTTNVEKNTAIVVRLYYSSRVTATIYITTNIRL